MDFLYETHLHTSSVSACASCSPARQVRAYKERGYAGIIVTDHFVNGNSLCPRELPWEEKMHFFATGYQEARVEGERVGLDVFFGWEYALSGTEFLTYGLSFEFLLAHPGMDNLTVGEYSDLVRQNGGYLAQAHPFRASPWIKNPFPVAPHLIDAIEVYNATMPEEVNAQALAFAKTHNLPMQSGSDAHHEELGFTGGIKLRRKADSIRDIIEAIKKREAALITP